MRRAVAGALALIAACSLSVRPAWAHADVEQTQPRNGAQLAHAPKAVTVTFGEDVSLANARLVDASGNDVPSQASVSGPILTITPTSPIPRGPVSAAWNVLSDDGHPVAGAIAFVVGPTSSAGPAQAPTAFPRLPVRLDGSRPGPLVITLSTAGIGGDVAWTSPAIPEPQTWRLVPAGGRLVARGVLPLQGTWTFTANVLKKGGAVVIVTGKAQLAKGVS